MVNVGSTGSPTIEEIAGKVGKLDLHVLRVQNSQATILATFSDEPEEAVVVFVPAEDHPGTMRLPTRFIPGGRWRACDCAARRCWRLPRGAG